MPKRAAVAVALALGLILGGAAGVAARQSHPHVRTTTHVVQAGETLWSIAGAVDPSGDPREGIDRIMRINGLSDALIVIGQALQIPAE